MIKKVRKIILKNKGIGDQIYDISIGLKEKNKLDGRTGVRRL